MQGYHSLASMTVLVRCANKPRWAKVGGARAVKLR